MLLTTGTGWIPDSPDPDDLHVETPSIHAQLAKRFAALSKDGQLPASINLQDDFPEVFDQGTTNSCTANAVCGLVDYFEKRARARFAAPSRMFVYKTTRNLLGTTLDGGAYLRTAMEALLRFGAPPESYWPFAPHTLAFEPPAFLYALASSDRALQRYRYDPPGVEKPELLRRIRANLAAGLPAAFGFYVFESMTAAVKTGAIPYPGPRDRGIGGHAVVAVGYDDARVIESPSGEPATTGAFRIRNSWSSAWGDGGHGWLPYEYVLSGLAIDWWSVLKVD